MDMDNVYSAINPRFINTPFCYDGKRDSRLINSWLMCYERFVRLTQVPNEVMVELAGTYLANEALHWFNDLGNSIQFINWNNFKDLLCQRFSDPTQVESVMIKQDNLKQRSTVELYIQEFHDLRALVPQDFRTESGDMRKFIKGLKYKTQIEVEARDPVSLEDAELKAFKFDQIFSRGIQQSSNKGFNSTSFVPKYNFNRSNQQLLNKNNISRPFTKLQSRPQESQVIPMEVDNTQFKRNSSNISMKNKSCFKCGKRGHFASNCLKENRQ